MITKKYDISSNILRLIIFSVLSYGIVYFSYKYFIPMQGGGGGDFFQYVYMYQNPLTFSSPEVSSPFIYRQLSGILTYIIYILAESGLYFDPPGFGILFTSSEVSQVVYFSGIISNYIALVLCAWGVSLVVDEVNPELPEIYPLSGGVLCFLSVHSQQHILTGLTEGWSWALIIFGFLFYIKKSRTGITVILLLSIMQREMILVTFGIFAIITIILNSDDLNQVGRSEGQIGYDMYVFALSIIAFSIYILMRTILIPVPGGESQLTPSVLLGNILSPKITLNLILSTFYVQNIVFLYIFAASYLYIKNINSNVNFLYHIILIFVAMVAIGLATGIGNNIGRISGLLTSLTAALTPRLLYNISEK